MARNLASFLVAEARVEVAPETQAIIASAYEAVLRGKTCHRHVGEPPSGKLFGPSAAPGGSGDEPHLDAPLAVLELAKPEEDGTTALVYLRSMDDAEHLFVHSLAAINQPRSEPWKVDPEAEYLRPEDLSKDKHAALLALGRRRFLIVTGGPGTGKTRTIRAMLKVAQTAGKVSKDRIAVLAPTHRARIRIQEGLDSSREDAFAGIQAQTVHAFIRDSRNGLKADFVVVDEASMVDLVTFRQLLDSLSFSASLIIVGDPDQLPSVDVGSVLADLCKSQALQKAKLGVLHRFEFQHRFGQDSPIARLAASINSVDISGVEGVANADRAKAGLVELTPEAVVSHVLYGEGNPYVEVVRLARAAALADVNEQQGLINQAMVAFGQLRLLCSHRVGPMGSLALSRLIMEQLKIASPQDDGAIIMVTRNDLDLGITNGEIGIVSGDRAYFQSGEEIKAFGLAQLPEYLPAFATTIHASQGSQFGKVIVVLGKTSKEDFISRQMVYTAVTRAEREVVLLAEDGAVSAALKASIGRASGLQYRLA
jgi:exodeoxyribonuclease V alpha subunit